MVQSLLQDSFEYSIHFWLTSDGIFEGFKGGQFYASIV